MPKKPKKLKTPGGITWPHDNDQTGIDDSLGASARGPMVGSGNDGTDTAVAANERGREAIVKALDFYDHDPDGDVTLVLKTLNNGLLGAQDRTSEIEILDEGSGNKENESPGDGSIMSKAMDVLQRDPAATLRVSSKHLMLASRVFKKMLQAGFQEGQTLLKDGHVELALYDDDPIALEIFLNTIHGRFRNVPESVDLKTLTQIAIFANKYDCAETFLLLMKTWCNALQATIPKTICEDLLRWMCINQIFGRSVEMVELTRIAISQSTMKVETELPMLGILDEIEQLRCGILRRQIEFMDGLLSDMKTSPYFRCSTGGDCNSVLMGTFLRGVLDCELYPFPEYPFRGLSIDELTDKISKLPVKSGCQLRNDMRDDRRFYYTEHTVVCQLQEKWNSFSEARQKSSQEVEQKASMVVADTQTVS